jgi:hypothetical protein
MAIEDAALLSSILSKASSAIELPASLQDFERQRMERKNKVQELSLQNLKLYHFEDGELQMKRDSIDCSGDENHLCPIWRNAKDQSWLYGYDISLS